MYSKLLQNYHFAGEESGERGCEGGRQPANPGERTARIRGTVQRIRRKVSPERKFSVLQGKVRTCEKPQRKGIFRIPALSCPGNSATATFFLGFSAAFRPDRGAGSSALGRLPSLPPRAINIRRQFNGTRLRETKSRTMARSPNYISGISPVLTFSLGKETVSLN